MSKSQLTDSENSIVAVEHFIQATRDSGYRSTAAALSELVDNSIEAGAKKISVSINMTDVGIEIGTCDDGCGMDPFTLRQALRFGGSSRFDNRQGLGRYGMGLPNSSLSQARRVDVYTWQNRNQRAQPAKVFKSYLDYDEIADGEIASVPAPSRVAEAAHSFSAPSGTMVLWTKCDRLDFKRISTAIRRVSLELGRRFRYFLTRGIAITVNGERLVPVDPLLLDHRAIHFGASLYGDEILYEVRANPNQADGPIGVVRVRFSELPVKKWSTFTNEQKREMGITKGGGVSVVRSGREVDSGWLFMGKKRRENYDDWWRCEVEFDPILDEAFGLTHTKQQVQPTGYLLKILSPDIEAIARQLNARVRTRHRESKENSPLRGPEHAATKNEVLLPPLPSTLDSGAVERMRKIRQKCPIETRSGNKFEYKIAKTTEIGTSLYSYAMTQNMLVLLINDDHPFFRELQRLEDGKLLKDGEKLQELIDLLLIAAARSEASETNRQKRASIAEFRTRWSDVLASYLNHR